MDEIAAKVKEPPLTAAEGESGDDNRTDATGLLASPSRKETLSEVLASMFVIEGSGFGSVATFIFSLLSFTWFIDSLLPIVQEAALRLYMRWSGATPTPTDFTSLLVKASVPSLIFMGIFVFLYWNRRRNTRPDVYDSIAPGPYKGLIVMLSKYNKRPGKEGYDSPDDIVAAIETGCLDLDKLFKGCNWGAMAFAVRYHAPALEHCWLIATKDGSTKHLDQAEQLIKHLAGRNVALHRAEIENENEIGEIANAISGLYRELTKKGPLPPSEVIADFTGGTAAMSTGMIIATLNERENIEYVNQRAELNSSITPQQTREQKIIISPRTSLRMARILTKR
ncbi:MAG: hypothetical protein AB1631_33480 [Acidobacteriota bacterium]